MARVIHLTPDGLGRRLTARERRSARALVGESIRTRLGEYRSRHLFARRPTHLAVLARRVTARRRTLLVVSDGDGPTARLILAATVRASAPRGGIAAALVYLVVKRASRGMVLFGPMVLVLALRHGHTSLTTLVVIGTGTSIATSPIWTSLRIRWGDRALAYRAARLLPELRNQLRGVAVIHDLGLPRSLAAPGPTLRDMEIVGAALQSGAIPTCIAEPCCLEAAEAFAYAGGALLVPQHASPERSVLVFARNSDALPAASEGDGARIVPIDRAFTRR